MMGLFQIAPSEWTAVMLSIQVSVLSVMVSLPLALMLGYILARKNFRGKSLLESVLHLPLVMPPVVTGYLLLLLFGTQGFLGHWLFVVFGVSIPFSFAAAVIASSVIAFPLMVRSIRTAMSMVDVGLEEASRTLGKGRLETFFRITVPLSAPGIISGVILAFARSLGEFGATITFAGNIAGQTQTLPLAVYAYIQMPGKEEPTMRLVIISLVISTVAMMMSEWFINKMRRS
ncbi:molybdate ABC transporter permease subunit [Geofilum sp. OHC36d9]|uniref:molybdate ABC transporter permease subunit n=1 Tax=Geofilum sp. OHC36d9 TaxID=3458413 RepID=UPI004033D311